MADITIPQLNAATSVSGTDVMVISQAGVTKKVEVDKLTEKVLSSSVDILHMNPATVQTLANIGELAFNPDTQTLEVKCSADVTLSIGQENYIRGKNAEASTILNGTVVYVSGGQGANSLIKRAGNADGTAERVIGVATQDIGANNVGFITTSGIVNKLNTSAYAEGTLLWLGTNGAMTNVKPDTTVNQICIGVVLRSHATQGSLLVAVKDDWRDKLAEVRSDLSEAITALEQEQIQGGVYDVSAHNDGAVFESLSTLLGSANLSTLIPTSVRRGGMSIRFAQNYDNKYVQYRLMSDTFNTTPANWQGVDDEPTAGSKNLVESGGVATMDYFAFELGSFKSDGTEEDGSYYQRLRTRSVSSVKVKFGDCVDFSAFDGVKFSWYVEFWDSQDSYIAELDSNWRNDSIKRYITQGDGAIRILVKKNDGVDFSEDDIRSLRGSFSIIKRQTNILFDSLHVSIERGTMDDGAIDNKNNPTIRVRSGLYDCKLTNSDSIVHIIETVDGSPLTYIAYLLDEDGIYNGRLTPNWTSGDLTVNEKGFVRFLFRKGNNASISDADIQNISNGISVQGKNYVDIDSITDELNVRFSQGNPQPLAMKLGYIDNNGGFASSTNKAVTDFICVTPNDRFYIMSSGLGSPVFRIGAVSYYTEKKEFLYTEKISNYLPYTVSRNGFVRVQITYSTAAAISIDDTNNVLYMTKYNSYVFGTNDYFLNSWESGRIKTDGTDFAWNHYCRTKLYFPVKKGDKLHIVDGVNYRYDLLRYNMDRAFIGNTGDMSKDQYITEDCLIRLSVKKSPDAAFTEHEISEMGKMFVIEPNFDNLSLPSYYDAEIEQVFDDYISNYQKQGISYLIITDTHDDYNLETKGLSDYLQRQCAAIVRLAKRTNALFVAMLGDITSGTAAKNHITDVTKCMMQILKQCGLPVFVVRGNHDDNTYISPQDERTAETTMFGDEFMARAANVGNPRLVASSQNDANGAYYCFDFDENKIRVIVLDDCCNYPVEYEGSYLIYSAGQANWRGVGTAQIQWFAELLGNTNYDIILLDHMSLNDAIHSDGTSVGGYHGFDSMNGIINAFQNHTSYSDEVVNCDFTGKTNTIIIENSGDNHTDYGAKGTNGIVYLNTGTASPTIGKISHYIPEGGSYQSVRTENTILEALFDFVMLNPDEVVRLRFGAGSNQTIQR